MIKNSREKALYAPRTLRDCPLPPESNVDVTLFANYYGSVKGTHSFNDPALYTDRGWLRRLIDEIKAIRVFRRKYKHAKNR